MIHIYKDDLVIPGVSKKRFVHISDAHLTISYSGDSDKYVELAKEQAIHWGTEGRNTRDNFEDCLEMAKQVKPDALVMTGDMLDYYHPSNMKYLTDKLDTSKLEWAYVYGNHEGSNYFVNIDTKIHYPDYKHLIGDDPAVWIKDYGDLLMVGLDNSDMNVSRRQIDILKQNMQRNLPIILVIHIPVITETLIPLTKKKWSGEMNNWKEYFLLGENSSSETAREFFRLVTDPSSPIAAIMAGHIHFASKGEFAPGKIQYTAGPGSVWDVSINAD